MNFPERYSENEKKRYYGVAIGVVTNNKDPESLGRVRLQFPWMSPSLESQWARVATLMAGNDRGTYFLPEVGDEVLVSFHHGDIAQPYVIGALWNSKDKPPEKNADGKNNTRIIKSKSGHQIIFNDEQGSERVELTTKSGNKVILDDSAGKEKLEIKDKTDRNSIIIDAVQNSICISSMTKVSIQAQMIEIKAGSTLNLQGGIVKIN